MSAFRVCIMHQLNSTQRAVSTRAIQFNFPILSIRDALAKYQQECDELAASKEMPKMDLATAVDVDVQQAKIDACPVVHPMADK